MKNKKAAIRYLGWRLIALVAVPVVLASNVYADDVPAKIQIGDQWTYDETNDITGAPNGRLLMTVTETGDKDFTVHIGSPNNNGGYLIIFDYDWNAKEQAQTKMTPHDGRGAPHDAKVGTSWNTNFTWKDMNKGGGGKGQATGKCVSDEKLEVQAGTFDTLKCVTVIKIKPPGGGPAVTETEITTWFAPQTLRWARRKFVTRERGHVSESRTHELIAYELKQ